MIRRLLPLVSAAGLSVSIVAQTTSAPANQAAGDLSTGSLNVLHVVSLVCGVGAVIWHAAVTHTTVKRNDKHMHGFRNALQLVASSIHKLDRRMVKIETKMGIEVDDDDAPATPAGVQWFSKEDG